MVIFMNFDSRSQLPNVSTKRILVIDDERLVRESIVIYLEDSGYNTSEAEDGTQAISSFKNNQPDLVLCDLRMPGMDGLEVLKHLTALSPDIPVIIVSGAGQIHDVVEALRLGAIDYLVKPITDMLVLENAINNALTRHQLEKENKLHKEELVLANNELEKNLTVLQQDQEAGRQAQLQLLPEPNMTINDYHFQHVIIPSLNLSGDFIDYFKISERYLGFYIADVSGHGVAAAFVTMILKSLINQPLRLFRMNENHLIIEPAKFMKYINDELINANLGKHITMFYGVIDCQENNLNYVAAGQYPAPVFFSKDKTYFLDVGGFPLGLFEWANFEDSQVEIDSDFKLLMVSDGWLDIIAGDSELIEESFLLDYAINNQITIASLLEPIKESLQENMPDDITIFTISRAE